MFMLTILTLLLIVLFGIFIVAFLTGGSVFVLIFGDILVFVLVIVWLFKRIRNKN